MTNISEHKKKLKIKDLSGRTNVHDFQENKQIYYYRA